MDHAALISDLSAFFRPDQLLTSVEDCSVYAFDGTALLHQRPACVALPESREEVAQLLALCNQRGSARGAARLGHWIGRRIGSLARREWRSAWFGSTKS